MPRGIQTCHNSRSSRSRRCHIADTLPKGITSAHRTAPHAHRREHHRVPLAVRHRTARARFWLHPRKLSSPPGAAVTSIRIDGVLHEFSTVPGVKEDVTEIILNIKNLVISSEHDEPITAYLRKQGAGEVTAADISAPAGVEVHSPELVIATL